MSVSVLLAVGALGGLGAVARFLLDGAVTRRVGGAIPYGTLVVNIAGSLLAGMLLGAAVSGDAHRLAATGLLGSFTTFSTWAFESHRLGEAGQLRLGVLNFAVSLALGLMAVWLGRELGAAL